LLREVYNEDLPNAIDVVWHDKNITGGDEWWKEITTQIKDSDIFIYLLSNEAYESTYCQAEYAEAIRLQKQILPVIVRQLSNIRLTDNLQHIQYVDMASGINPENLSDLHRAIIILSRKIQGIVFPARSDQVTPLPIIVSQAKKSNRKRRLPSQASYLGGHRILEGNLQPDPLIATQSGQTTDVPISQMEASTAQDTAEISNQVTNSNKPWTVISLIFILMVAILILLAALGGAPCIICDPPTPQIPDSGSGSPPESSPPTITYTPTFSPTPKASETPTLVTTTASISRPTATPTFTPSPTFDCLGLQNKWKKDDILKNNKRVSVGLRFTPGGGYSKTIEPDARVFIDTPPGGESYRCARGLAWWYVRALFGEKGWVEQDVLTFVERR
jgi:hypothetical protein